MSQSWKLLEDLFAIPRTLLGQGFEASLARIGQDIPLQVLRLESGTACGSWKVLPEWVLHRAQLRGPDGSLLLCNQTSPGCVWQYSTSFTGTVDGQTLKRSHLATAPADPDGIPSLVTYYKERWGFGISQRQLEALGDGPFSVCIESAFKPGALSIGYAHLPGKSPHTILVDAVLSCGALANNLSGAVAAVALYKALADQPDRQLSYRFVFTPETIGPIAMAYHFPQLQSHVVGGVNLQNLADPGEQFFFKRSRPGQTLVDRAFGHTLSHLGISYEDQVYDVRTGHCGNEKAYNSLGIEVPLSALRRSQLGTYPQYDTHLDDLEFTRPGKLEESIELLKAVFRTLENNRLYRHTFRGEPFLSGYGLFPQIEKDADRLPYDYLMGFTDGTQDLIALADRAGLPVDAFVEPARLMHSKGLLEKVPVQ